MKSKGKFCLEVGRKAIACLLAGVVIAFTGCGNGTDDKSSATNNLGDDKVITESEAEKITESTTLPKKKQTEKTEKKNSETTKIAETAKSIKN